MCQCELRTGGDLNGEGPLLGLNGHRLSAGPLSKAIKVSREQGHLAEGKVVAEILPMPRYVPRGLSGAKGVSSSNFHRVTSSWVLLLSSSVLNVR